jgi:hypothetical protein
VSRQPRVSKAPLAVTSDGDVAVNTYQLSVGRGLAAVIEVAKKSEGELFVGAIVPGRMRAVLLKDIDDVLADVVGRLGPHLMKRRGR